MRLIVLLTAAALGMPMAGCVSERAGPPGPPDRASLGVIGLRYHPAPPEIRVISIPSSRARGAAQGAGAAMVSSVRGCLEIDPTGLCFLGAFALSPYIAAGGAIYGSVTVKGEAEVRAAASSIADALRNTDFGDGLLQRVQEEMEKMGAENWGVENGGTDAKVLRALPPAAVPPEGAARQGGEPVPQGVDTLLELRIARVSLGHRPALHPPLPLRIEARARLVRGRDGVELDAAEFRYESAERHGFVAWGTGDAYPVRVALANGLDDLAARIVRRMLPRPTPPQPPAGAPSPSAGERIASN